MQIVVWDKYRYDKIWEKMLEPIVSVSQLLE